ncbi:MAG: signal peptide peptidase SppA [Clostridiales Family XIII bacterium]|jgi:protease-4|nr:signal peptide peptidase SppA [Clostridiales Family XIII bacterium]
MNNEQQPQEQQQPRPQEQQQEQNYAYTGYGYPNPGSASPYAYSYAPGAPKKKRWPIVLIIVVSALVFIGLMAAAARCSLSSAPPSNTFVPPGGSYLAKISVIGEIGDANDVYSSSDESYHHQWTMDMIDDIKSDENNAGLILVVDSPGGGVYESDELYHKIQAYREETERPVYVYMRSMAASGGYYISAPATEIVANRNTWTGSIGVIVGTLFDVSGFLEKNGIKAEEITSGPNKSMGSYFEPMTKEQRAIFQSMVDEAYGQFVDIVADGRDMSVEQVKKIADGRIMTASQALEAGLIDKIAGEGDFYDYVRGEMGDDEMPIENIYYDADDSNVFSSLIPSLIEAFGGKPAALDGQASQSDIARVLKLAETDGKAPIKYLYSGS